MPGSVSSVSTERRMRADRLAERVAEKVRAKAEKRARGQKPEKVKMISKTLEEQGYIAFTEEEEEESDLRAKRLYLRKKRMDMADGDEHFNVGVTSVGPVNDMYVMLKMLSSFGAVTTVEPLVTNTKINSGK